MKYLFLIACIAFSSVLHAEIGLYTTDSTTSRKVNEIESIVKDFVSAHPDKNILFYVHGRSKTLEKEWNNINEIEKVYNLKVIMLHWDSWNNMLGRPVGNAKKASQMFNDSIVELSKIKNSKTDFLAGKKFFLLCHSMGVVTFKNYIENFNQDAVTANLFDSLTLSGADVPFKNHSKWLSQVNLSSNINIIMNKNDAVLLASDTLAYIGLNLVDDKLGLGVGVDNYIFFNTQSVKKSTYYDLTSVSGKEHRHYLSSYPEVRSLFRYLFMEETSLSVPYSQKENLIKLK